LLAHRMTASLVGARVFRCVPGLLIDRVVLRPAAGRFGLIVACGRLLGGNLEEGHFDHLFQCAV